MIRKDFQFSGEEGFHARPVSEFVSVAKQFQSKIQILFEEECYEGKSPLSIMCGCIEDGCIFTLCIEGEDEQAAYDAILQKMASGKAPYFVEPAAEAGTAQEEAPAEAPVSQEDAVQSAAQQDAQQAAVPAGQDEAQAALLPLSGGIAFGKVLIYRRQAPQYEETAEDPGAEEKKLSGAFDEVKAELLAARRQAADPNAAGILAAHGEILEDHSFLEAIREKIQKDHCSAAHAIRLASDELHTAFEALKSDRMRERAADIKDVANRLMAAVLGIRQDLQITQPDTILVADELLPSDTIHLDPSMVAGFITEKGGKNSHTAIVARSLGIPAVSNAAEATAVIPDGADLILDGDAGRYFVSPPPEIRKEYEEKDRQRRREREIDALYRSQPSRTTDGKQLEISANIFGAAEMGAAIHAGAEGVGLFRTEFLYMNRQDAPGLEEQFLCYKTLLEKAEGLPITIRTLDAGGDKPTPCLHMPKEDNPFLGVRAIRFCLRNKEIFRTQLKALLMTASYGNLRIMFPMISTVEELRDALSILEEEKEKLQQEGQKPAPCQVGIMIETPAAAIMSEKLAEQVDFFSIGSNDLTQYVMAADRGAEALSCLHDPYQPAVLRMIRLAADAARKKGIWIGICGESGADPLLIPLYVGMGLRELSMAASRITAARRIVNNLSWEEMQAKVDYVLEAATAAEVKSRLEELQKI